MRTVLAMLLLLLLAANASADESLLLPQGAYGATVRAGLASGETRLYYVKAERGQQFTAKLSSSDTNGYLLITDSEGKPLLEGLSETTQIREVDVILPRSGTYTLEVGTGEQQCTYILEVTLDDPVDPAH